jgi:HlyD family secretion protein
MRGSRSRLARRRVVLLSVGGAAALLSVGGLIGSTFVKSPAQLAADTAPPPSTVTTAKGTDQVLTASVAMRGVVYPSTQYNISAQGDGQLYVTKMGVSAGTLVINGQLLAEIDGQPMFVLKGAVPAWRTLLPGSSGPDVAELQNALSLLGDYDGADKAGYFGAATKDAVSAFYAHLGYPAPTTGAATQQAVNQSQQTVNADEQRIKGLRGQQLTVAEAKLSSDEQTLASAEAVNGPEVPQDQVVFVPAVPSTAVAINGGVGQQPGSPFLELSARDALSLTGELPPAYASQVKAGLTVTIYDAVTGNHATGKVASVGAATTTVPAGTTVTIGGGSSSGSSGSGSGGSSSGSTSGSAFVPVTITPTDPLPASMNGDNVLVTVQTGQTEGPVLAVPVAAIVTTASGQSFVTVVVAGGKQTNVPVTPGMSANGYVQVTPGTKDALTAGDDVVVSG